MAHPFWLLIPGTTVPVQAAQQPGFWVPGGLVIGVLAGLLLALLRRHARHRSRRTFRR